MKWVKVAIGAVIAILSIGIVATSVYDMTQEKLVDKEISFEVIQLSQGTGYTEGTSDLINDMVIIEEGNITNFKGLSINGTEVNNIVASERTSPFAMLLFKNADSTTLIGVRNNDQHSSDTTLILGDTVNMTFEVLQPAQLTGINATLLLLTPLIFAGGVLAYLLNKQEL